MGFRGIGFSPMFALLKPTFSLPPRPRLLTLPLHPSAERSPTIHIHNFGASLSPVHFRRKGAGPVSCYALFKGWLLLSQPPGCLRTPTSLTTERCLGGLSWWSGLFPSRRWSLSPTVSLPTNPGVFAVWFDLVQLSPPASIQSSTPPGTCRRCASTHFGENQLALGSIGISPLTTAHPMILQHQPVRPSTWLYPSFSLAMVRSPRFGSTACDQRPIQTRFPFGSGIPALTCPTL